MTNLNTPGGDYVNASPERKKLSRGRKSLIGLLVVGAVAAMANTGTFASFTASTDNASGDNPFSVDDNDLVLSNTVNEDGGAAGAECLSTEDQVAENAATCDVLFTVTQDDLQATYTTYVRLENDSNPATIQDADLDLMAPGGCVNASVGGANLCNELLISVEEWVYDADSDAIGNDAPGAGTYVAPGGLDDALFSSLEDELYPVACHVGTAVGQTCDYDNGDTLTAALNPLSTTSTELVNALPTTDETTNTGVRFYKIVVVANTAPGCTDFTGVSTTTGIGCENHVAGGDAEFNLRWILNDPTAV